MTRNLIRLQITKRILRKKKKQQVVGLSLPDFKIIGKI